MRRGAGCGIDKKPVGWAEILRAVVGERAGRLISRMPTAVRKLLELVRFSHTLFALPFALTAAALAWYAEGEFRVLDAVGILAGMVFGRSFAMAVNRVADRAIDARN